MNINRLFKFCPPQQQPVDTCPSDLEKSRSDLATCEGGLETCQGNLAAANSRIADMIGQLAAAMAFSDKCKMLINGPAAPAKDSLRLLSGANMQQLWAVRLGQPFLDCLNRGGVHFAWPPWLVCKQSDVLVFLDFYNTNILPLMKAYIVLDWTDTKGNKVQVSGRTCSDFAALFWGLPTMYPGWTPLAWGMMWAYVESLFLTGGHAFNFVVCWDTPFTEDTIDGLSLLEIEPQTSGRWTAAGVALDASARVDALDLKPVTPERFSGVEGGYKIDSLYNVTA